MGNGRASLWDGAPIAIKQVLGILGAAERDRRDLRSRSHDDIAAARLEGQEATGKMGGTPEVNAAYLHTKLSFRALFDGIDPNTYVTKTVVAAYLGLASKTLEQGLQRAFPKENNKTWRAQLAEHPKKAPPPPAMRLSKYCWSFVIDEMPSLLKKQLERARERRESLTMGPVKPRNVPLLYLGAKERGIQYLVDGRGRVLYALGQSHIPISRFLQDCDAGARLVSMSVIEALSKPWVDLVAREAWENAVVEVMEESMSSLRLFISHGRAESERLLFSETFEESSIQEPRRLKKPI